MNTFYERREWKELRYKVLRKYGYKCMACGASKSEGTQIHVDHIKPIYTYPELALREDNLQVLCRECNLGKSNKFDDDLRPATRPREFVTVSNGSSEFIVEQELRDAVFAWVRFLASDDMKPEEIYDYVHQCHVESLGTRLSIKVLNTLVTEALLQS